MSLKMRYNRKDDVPIIRFAQNRRVDHAEQSTVTALMPRFRNWSATATGMCETT